MIIKNRLRFVLVCVLLFLSLYLLYTVISPLWTDISALNTEKKRLLDDIAQSKKMLPEISEPFTENMISKNQKMDFLPDKDIPHKESLDEVMKELEEIFSNSSVKISGVRFGKLQLEEESILASIPVNILVKESFNREGTILKFVEDIASFPYLFTIESINYNRGEKELIYAYGKIGISLAPESDARLSLSCRLYVLVD